MTSQTNEAAFESTVEDMLLEGGWNSGNRTEWEADASSLSGACRRVPAGDAARTPGRRWPDLHGEQLESADRGRAGQGTGPEGHAGRAAPRVQVLRQDVPAGLFQTGARAEPGGAGAVRAQRPDGHAAGCLQPEHQRNLGPGVCAQRRAGGHVRTEEPDDGSDLEERDSAVQAGP